jgi:iron complex outermembrane receptor protein
LTVTRPTRQGSITTFFSRIDDYILIYQGIRSKNVDVHRVGVELDFTKQLTPSWRLFGGMAWIRAQNLTGHGSGSVPLAQTPPLDGRFGVIYEQGTLAATFGGRAVAAQTRTYPGYGNSLGIDNPDPPPGFATANMSMTWKPVKQTQLSLGIDNIFDLTYYEHLSRRIGDVPPGFVNFVRLNEPGEHSGSELSSVPCKEVPSDNIAAGPGCRLSTREGDLHTHGDCTLRAKFIRSLLHISCDY